MVTYTLPSMRSDHVLYLGNEFQFRVSVPSEGAAHHSQILHGVAILQLQRQCALDEPLVADRTGKAKNSLAAHRGRASVGSCRIRASVYHRVGHFYSCGITIEENAAGLALQHRDQFRMLDEIFLFPEYRRRQMAMQRLRGLDQLMSVPIVDQQRLRPKNLMAQGWLR